MILLTKNFTLEELTYSATASAKGIANTMSDPKEIIKNLKLLCEKVLQPTRDHFGPLTVTSGYTNYRVSQLLGRKVTSQHFLGSAADIVSNKIRNYDIAVWIKDNLVFDQLIYEVRKRINGKTYDWVHVSFRNDGKPQRKEVLSSIYSGYTFGLPERSYV